MFASEPSDLPYLWSGNSFCLGRTLNTHGVPRLVPARTFRLEAGKAIRGLPSAGLPGRAPQRGVPAAFPVGLGDGFQARTRLTHIYSLFSLWFSWSRQFSSECIRQQNRSQWEI